MRGDSGLWVPAHEAGHAVFALSVGQQISYVIASRWDVDSVTWLKNSNGLPASIMGPLSTAGFAAESIVRRECRPEITDQDLRSHSLDRCGTDLELFCRCIGEAGREHNTFNIELFIKQARIVEDKIEQHAELFHAIRNHLTLFGFISSAGLGKLRKCEPIDEETVVSDFQKISHAQIHYDLISPQHQTAAQRLLASKAKVDVLSRSSKPESSSRGWLGSFNKWFIRE